MWFVFQRTIKGTSEIPGQFILTVISINLVVTPIFINNIEEEGNNSSKLQFVLLEIKIIGTDYEARENMWMVITSCFTLPGSNRYS